MQISGVQHKSDGLSVLLSSPHSHLICCSFCLRSVSHSKDFPSRQLDNSRQSTSIHNSRHFAFLRNYLVLHPHTTMVMGLCREASPNSPLIRSTCCLLSLHKYCGVVRAPRQTPHVRRLVGTIHCTFNLLILFHKTQNLGSHV